jgi:microcystin degradation protein MlrC
MRVFVGSITHETNRFSPFPTVLADYHPATVGYEDLIREAELAGCEVVRGLCARAAPSGPTLQADYEKLREQLLTEIHAAGPLDMVLLNLHGAQVAQGCEDCEGDIVSHVRETAGAHMTVGVLLDLHASITDTLLQHASLVTVIKEYPHTDFPETARQLVTLSMRIAGGQVRPLTAFVPVPVFTLWHTPQQPSKALVDLARSLETQGQALHISLVHGFPWSDVYSAGAAVMVTTDDAPERATQLAADFAHKLWDIRKADIGHYKSIAHCLDVAVTSRTRSGPLVIADAADNPGAGTGSDATWILREVLDRGIDDVALALFWDPQALRDIQAAGEGARLELKLGGHTGELAGQPLTLDALVTCIRSDAMIDAMPGYPPIAVGALAAVKVGTVSIVVGAYREQVFGPRVFTEVGIDPARQRLLVVKSAQHFYKAFQSIAAEIIYCDSPCSRTIEFSRLPFRHRRKPVWPLDPVDADALPAPILFSQ